MMKPPVRLEEAQKISIYSPYRDWHLCVYCGGAGGAEGDMHWGYGIYDKNGDRCHWQRLWDYGHAYDAADVEKIAQALVDQWADTAASLYGCTYEDILRWRHICEYLWNKWGRHSCHIPTSAEEIERRFPGCSYLVSVCRFHRQLLWDRYKIQFIKWNGEGWCLKGNWEYKIDFLEQVVILKRNPDELPRLWLDKWEKKRQATELKLKVSRLSEGLSRIAARLRWLKGINLPNNGELALTHVTQIASESRECKALLQELWLHTHDLSKNSHPSEGGD